MPSASAEWGSSPAVFNGSSRVQRWSQTPKELCRHSTEHVRYKTAARRQRPFRRSFPTGPLQRGLYALAAGDQRLTESTSTKNCRKTLPLRTEKGPTPVRSRPFPSERISVYGAKTGALAPVGGASCSQNWVPSARVAMWYPDRQLMSSEVRAPGRSVPGAVVTDSPHAASASVAVTASRTRIRIAAPSIDPSPRRRMALAAIFAAFTGL